MINRGSKFVWIVRWLIIFPILVVGVNKMIDDIPLTYFVIGTAVVMIAGTALLFWLLGRSQNAEGQRN